MPHDPTDERYRKPRQLRNTPLQKYIRLIAFGVTSLYALAMYISLRRNVLPYLDDEQNKIDLNDLQPETLDISVPGFLRNIADKFVWKPNVIAKAEIDTQTDESKDIK